MSKLDEIIEESGLFENGTPHEAKMVELTKNDIKALILDLIGEAKEYPTPYGNQRILSLYIGDLRKRVSEL